MPRQVSLCSCKFHLVNVVLDEKTGVPRRCDRNRKRSKRRPIYCPIEGAHLDSVSPKHSLFANLSEQLQARGMSRKTSLLLMSTRSTVSLDGEWLEAFWCQECQKTQWYHVRKTGPRAYNLSIPPPELWQQAQGVLDPNGNPSVGEFTRRQSRMVGCSGSKDFKFIY